MTHIEFDKVSRKYVGSFNGKVVVKSTNQYYVKRKMASYTEAVTAFVPTPKCSDEFGINKRFEFLNKMVGMVASKVLPSAVIAGQGGLGKTHSVLSTLNNAGLVNITDLDEFEEGARLFLSKCYRVVKGYSTAKGLYRTLFECNNMVVVFDDCDSVLKDPIALNILKGALDSYSDRYISWNADMRDEDLPRSFKFTGQVVFITNMDLERIDQAIRSRCLCVDLSMTEEQKLERMDVIVKEPSFLKEYDTAVKEEALKFLKEEMFGKAVNLTLRSLISTIKIAATGDDWKSLAKYVLTQGA
ncbi:hypothetical protein EBR43_01905 [bacterium]|nr:hypothetical protein [bacterium]